MKFIYTIAKQTLVNGLAFSEILRSFNNETIKPVKERESGRDWINKIEDKYSK